MKLEDVLSFVTTGDVILVHRKWEWKDFISSIVTYRIRKLTHSYFNHIAIIGNNGKYVYEVHFNGIEKTPVKDYLNDKTIDYSILFLKQKNPAVIMNINKFLTIEYHNHKKIKYDIMTILKIRWHLLRYGHLYHLKDKEGDNLFICSTFVKEALKSGGYSLPDEVLTPADFLVRYNDLFLNLAILKKDDKIKFVKKEDLIYLS